MSVAHLPGGAALDTMLRKVKGDPGAIDTLAAAWRGVSGDVDEFARGLSAAVRTVDNAWKGRAADQFDTYMGKYQAAAGDLKSALSNAASSLGDAASALREAHTEIAAIIRDLSTSATTYENAYYKEHPDATAEDVRPGLTKLVEQAKADAQPWVDAADAAVTKAKNDIGRFLDERGQTFHGIPEVTTQTFVPPRGKSTGWEPEPDYRPQAGTSLQGADGGLRGPEGGGGFGGYGSSGPPPAVQPTGQVKEWIEQAMAILERNGVPRSKMDPVAIATIIKHESGGNPHAINTWDSNAARGTPSKGLMQTIDPTFNAYALNGHKDIWNPVDNIIAGVRYAVSRYGSVSNVPGLRGNGYVGY
ncbi:Phage tail length tape-measure protein [[Actinomadura] parvosata subsp. kistnae]|nr:transglycosylase SLT domain-containing protein [Nonomuraea sp. ATCC 55076]SPL95189.1 Phage tail length tape-measure protein [Actinomadura parvosata subsp. kistnae]